MSDKDFTGDCGGFGIGSGPVDNWYWQVLCHTIDPSATSTASNVWMDVRLTYYVKFFNRINLSG